MNEESRCPGRHSCRVDNVIKCQQHPVTVKRWRNFNRGSVTSDGAGRNRNYGAPNNQILFYFHTHTINMIPS